MNRADLLHLQQHANPATAAAIAEQLARLSRGGVVAAPESAGWAGGKSAVTADLNPGAQPPAPSPADRMNGWERRYAAHLDGLKAAGEVAWWEFEPVRLRVGVGAFYRPDFLVRWRDGRVTADEVKGHERAAAVVRWKAAADRFPWVTFRMLRPSEGGWRVTREVLARLT